jgi:hypothetical protein
VQFDCGASHRRQSENFAMSLCKRVCVTNERMARLLGRDGVDGLQFGGRAAQGTLAAGRAPSSSRTTALPQLNRSSIRRCFRPSMRS